MSNPPVTDSVLHAQLANLVELAPADYMASLCALLKSTPAERAAEDLIRSLPWTNNASLGQQTRQLLRREHAPIRWSELGWALEAAWFSRLSQAGSHSVEVVWSGPASGEIGIRRTDQVLYDLFSEAKESILLVTFAAAHIPLVNQSLGDAIRRGVVVSLFLETTDDSGGQLSVNAAKAFSPEVASKARVLVWPRDSRECNERGLPGKLHAKCAIVDARAAFISSANLTDDALNRNMELGILIRGGEVPRQLAHHFQNLCHGGVFIEA